jgi:hypothetical protein
MWDHLARRRPVFLRAHDFVQSLCNALGDAELTEHPGGDPTVVLDERAQHVSVPTKGFPVCSRPIWAARLRIFSIRGEAVTSSILQSFPRRPTT